MQIHRVTDRLGDRRCSLLEQRTFQKIRVVENFPEFADSVHISYMTLRIRGSRIFSIQNTTFNKNQTRASGVPTRTLDVSTTSQISGSD